ncbi:MAG TPA: response regulator [Desulfonatronum sp.]|nr:response regulator [Desulfonatronum sp.]
MGLINVLVVDDEPDYLETLVKRLSKRNYSVRGASGGLEALELLRQEPADVVLLDIKMPGMDGMQTLQEIKKKSPDTRVIILTGHASVESARDGISLGAFDYLVKPSTLDEIMIKIQESLHANPSL